jgi:hypothetical protein
LIQAAFTPKPPLQLSHLTVVGLVIVTQQVQEAVEGQDLKLNRKGVRVGSRLALRDAGRDDDIA